VTSLTFYFDPACPYTWLTSRWLVDAIERSEITVTWRAFSLSLINAGREIPEEYVAVIKAGTRALRVIESLASEGRNDDVAAFYTAYGTRLFVEQAEASDELLLAAAAAAGIDDALERASDESNDELIKASFDEIRPLVGSDVGTPAIRLDGTDRALFGPIVSPSPRGNAGDQLLEAFVTLLQIPAFFEIKRSREGALDFS